jgi:hypothetical protein
MEKPIAEDSELIPSMKLQSFEFGDVFFRHFLSMAVCVELGGFLRRRGIVASLPAGTGGGHTLRAFRLIVSTNYGNQAAIRVYELEL